jgi:ribosome biogenesis GTPase A
MTAQETRLGIKDKTRDLLAHNLKVVDLVFELVDARCPLTSRSREVNDLIRQKRQILILNKSDLAEAAATEKWLHYFKLSGIPAVAVDAQHHSGFKPLWSYLENLAADINAALAKKGRQPRVLRTAVFGIPNIGKSTFLNKMIGHNSAATGNKPGVTRGPQWVHLKGSISVMDTPGVLVPYLNGAERLFKLSVIGALDPQTYDLEDISNKLLELISLHYPKCLSEVLCFVPGQPLSLESLACSKKLITGNGQPDVERAAMFLLNSLRVGKLGGLSLEWPETGAE